MARKFLSFLGTNNYVACTYFQAGQEIANVRFVQEALIRMHCSDWTSEDQIVVFTTPEALKKNWEDDGHPDEKCLGLRRCLFFFARRKLNQPAIIPLRWKNAN